MVIAAHADLGAKSVLIGPVFPLFLVTAPPLLVERRTEFFRPFPDEIRRGGQHVGPFDCELVWEGRVLSSTHSFASILSLFVQLDLV